MKLDEWSIWGIFSIISFLISIFLIPRETKSIWSNFDIITTLILFISASAYAAWLNAVINPNLREPKNPPLTYDIFKEGGLEIPTHILIFGLTAWFYIRNLVSPLPQIHYLLFPAGISLTFIILYVPKIREKRNKRKHQLTVAS